jgi:hypothetical protein
LPRKDGHHKKLQRQAESTKVKATTAGQLEEALFGETDREMHREWDIGMGYGVEALCQESGMGRRIGVWVRAVVGEVLENSVVDSRVFGSQTTTERGMGPPSQRLNVPSPALGDRQSMTVQ